MTTDIFERICAIFASLVVAVFVLGLAWGISSGFAGFWGGFPFWVISLSVLSLVFYDLWDTTLRNKQPSD